jgi:hypothetical protein
MGKYSQLSKVNKGICNNFEFMIPINLNDVRMIVIQTAKNGVVDNDTVFAFTLTPAQNVIETSHSPQRLCQT